MFADARDERISPNGQVAFYRQWPSDRDGLIEEGVWTETAPAVYGPEDPETGETPLVTPAVWEMVTSTRPLSVDELERWDAAERAALIPELSDGDMRSSLAILAEDAFYVPQLFAQGLTKAMGTLLAGLVAQGVIDQATADGIGAAAPLTDVERAALKDAVRSTVRALEDPSVRAAYNEDRLKKARGMQP